MGCTRVDRRFGLSFYLFTSRRHGNLDNRSLFSYLLSVVHESHAYPRRSRATDDPHLRNAARHPYRHLRHPHPFARKFNDDASLPHLQSWFRANPMPHTLEGFKLAEESGMRSGRLIIALMFAAVVGNSRIVLGISPCRVQYRCCQRPWDRWL